MAPPRLKRAQSWIWAGAKGHSLSGSRTGIQGTRACLPILASGTGSKVFLASPVSSQHRLIHQNDQERAGPIEESGQQLGQRGRGSGRGGGALCLFGQPAFHLFARAARPKLLATQQGIPIPAAPLIQLRQARAAAARSLTPSSAEETEPNRKKIVQQRQRQRQPVPTHSPRRRGSPAPKLLGNREGGCGWARTPPGARTRYDVGWMEAPIRAISLTSTTTTLRSQSARRKTRDGHMGWRGPKQLLTAIRTVPRISLKAGIARLFFLKCKNTKQRNIQVSVAFRKQLVTTLFINGTKSWNYHNRSEITGSMQNTWLTVQKSLACNLKTKLVLLLTCLTVKETFQVTGMDGAALQGVLWIQIWRISCLQLLKIHFLNSFQPNGLF